MLNAGLTLNRAEAIIPKVSIILSINNTKVNIDRSNNLAFRTYIARGLIKFYFKISGGESGSGRGARYKINGGT